MGRKTYVKAEEITHSFDDIYTFSYTSGTTGPPKGVMLSNENVLAFLNTLAHHTDLKTYSSDVYLSYLPLPHVMERCVALQLFYIGAYLV
jgi:long-chain acyl-CoA synthetase